MKKLFCLILALCLCFQLTALAEAPAASIPENIAFADFQAAFNQVYANLLPDMTITWEQSEETPDMQVALADGVLILAMVYVKGDLVDEVAVAYQGSIATDEEYDQSLNLFIVFSVSAGTALLMQGGLDMATADALATDEFVRLFSATVEGTEDSKYFDRSGFINASTEDGATATFIFCVDMFPEE